MSSEHLVPKLKPLVAKNLAAAIALAKHYRDLNQPDDAESICRDVLAVAPSDEDALRTLGLALTDRFPKEWVSLFQEACDVFARLHSPYERVYYTAIAWERYAKAQAEAGRAHNAVHAFEEAMSRFEEAAKLAPDDEPAPILHYNRCVRAITDSADLLRAAGMPETPHSHLGD